MPNTSKNVNYTKHTINFKSMGILRDEGEIQYLGNLASNSPEKYLPVSSLRGSSFTNYDTDKGSDEIQILFWEFFTSSSSKLVKRGTDWQETDS